LQQSIIFSYCQDHSFAKQFAFVRVEWTESQNKKVIQYSWEESSLGNL
jgi:hypothetical protein